MKRLTFTPKQSRFLDEWMIDMNGAAAAERSGFSKKTSRAIASELLTKPDIQSELRRRQDALAKELQITRTGLVKNLLDVFELSRDLKQPATMVSSMALVAKILGYYSPEVKRVELIPEHGDIAKQMRLRSDAELLALIAAGA
jgi:phage terminase small subunit